MAGWVVIGSLAAFGALSLAWCFLGWLLPKDESYVVCFCHSQGQAEAALLRCVLLRSLGLIRGSLLIVGNGFPARFMEKAHKWYPGVEFCEPDALSARLELEREQIG